MFINAFLSLHCLAQSTSSKLKYFVFTFVNNKKFSREEICYALIHTDSKA